MYTGGRKSSVTFVPSPDARIGGRADTYGRSEREERAMGIMDFEVQRERRVEMLREAKTTRVAGQRSLGWGVRAFTKLAGILVIIR
jgi:hypothetical protein